MSRPRPSKKVPVWLIVENASSRLRWRWAKHIVAPTIAVAAPSTTSVARRPAACADMGPEKMVQYTRASPYRASSTITPENRTHTGTGATAWASASQK